MSNNKTQLNINDSQGARPSGFVIDLRNKVKTETSRDLLSLQKKAERSKKELEKIEAKIQNKLQKRADREIKYLEKKANNFGPNLLDFGTKKPKARIKRNISWPSLALFSRPSSTRSSSACSSSKSSLLSWHFGKKKSLWERVSAEQAQIFAIASKFNFKSLKRIASSEKRAGDAETKVLWYRSISSFVFVLILLIVPLKLLSYFELLDLSKFENKILNSSELAMNNLMAATNSVTKMDLKSADVQFKDAGANFLAAQSELDKINDSLLSLAALSNNPKLKLAAESKKFIEAGAIASSLGRNLVLATDSLFSGGKENFSSALDHFTYYGGLAVTDSKNLKAELDKVNPKNLPPEYQDQFISISKQTALLSDNLEAFVNAGAKFKDFLGATQDKRYLLVFQNNSELRASGGFLGSYALVDIRNGKIRNLEVPGGGSYDTEGGMSVRVTAPKPLWLVNPLWHFWDANWWPNWPTTAKNLMWFYEKSDGPTVDGVISVTPTVVERLLEITGPIDLTKEYGLTIDANNFWDTTQKIVEQKNLAKTNPEAIIGVPATSTVIKSNLPIKQGLDVNSANKPKKIIGDLMAKILEVLPTKLNKDSLVQILSLTEDSLAEKQVLFYFNDPSLQAEVSKRNWAGEVKDTDRDYLMVVDTNIAGQKSDRKMVEKINHVSEVSNDGSIINTVTITRTHTGTKNEAMTGVRNVDWLRVYVPKGSALLSADGFRIPEAKYFHDKPDPSWQELPVLQAENHALVEETSGTKVYEEDNKTVFANWAMVDPGETETITLKYRLPFNFLDHTPENETWLTKINTFLNPDKADLIPYSFMVQKQPGAMPSDFTSRLSLPTEWPIFWRYPDNLSGLNGWQINDKLNSDKYWSIIIEKK